MEIQGTIHFRIILPHIPGFQQEPLPEPVCSHSPDCKDCPYPRHGFLCWGTDGTCLRSRMNEINKKEAHNPNDECSSEYSKSSIKEENSMKFNLNHNPANKTLSIPHAALQLSGLADVSDLLLHTDSGCILLMPGDPTVAELLKTISLLSAVTPQLISRLAERSQMAMETGMAETSCGACEHEPHCSGLEIPPCQLAEAGISPNAALESFVEDGRIIVQAAEKTAADVLIGELDDDVRTMLENSGVQMEGVCRLLEKEEISG